MLFISGVSSAISAELAAVARSIEGVGYAHVYGVLNLSFGVGSTIGPIIGGQMYDHLANGWTAIVLLNSALCALSVIAAMLFLGSPTAMVQIIGWIRRKEEREVGRGYEERR